MNINELNDIELLFELGVRKDNYKKAYAEMKEIEEEVDNRYKTKMKIAINSGGKNGVREQIDKLVKEYGNEF